MTSTSARWSAPSSTIFASAEWVADIALTFHVAVAELVVAVAERVRSDRALATVALTGGVFQNSLSTRSASTDSLRPDSSH